MIEAVAHEHRRVLLDASSLMYRAYFSMPTSVTDSKGRPMNAVHGCLNMTAWLIADRRPTGTVHVYDHDWRPAPRVAVYAGYKAARPPDPEGLPEQFPILQQVLEAFGLEQAESPDWEAEDAIGAICAQAGSKERIDIVTGDRDLIQLVRDPAVRVLFTVKGVSQLRELDEAGVLERFGVPAARYADFAILRGDPSDGLPGVRGVGEKTARALIEAYPTLDGLLADAARPTPEKRPLKGSPQLRARIRDAAGYLADMRQVAVIRSDVPLRSWAGKRDDERLEELATRYKLGGAIGRLRKALAARDGTGG
jgi:5'-3' exonuclease